MGLVNVIISDPQCKNPQPDMESIFTKIIYEIFWS